MDVSATMQDFFEAAQGAFEEGASAVKRSVAGAAIEQQPFMRGFVRMCNDGWLQGWHERNGGNLTYRMTEEEVRACKPFFDDASDAVKAAKAGEGAQAGKAGEGRDAWVSMGVQADNLRNAYFVTTGAGCYMRNMQLDPAHNVGIVEINSAGDAWRIVWGLKDGGVPTSEFPSHFLNHSVRVDATDGRCRVLYHAHPDSVIALTKIMPLDAREITRALWKAMTECIMVFPRGVGVAEWMIPGSTDIANATSELLKTYDAVIWAQHGLFCSGSNFDEAFGLMHAISKAADIHARALMMNNYSSDFPNTITDENLRAIAEEYDLKVNEDFLD